MTRDWWNREFRTLVTIGESITAGGSASCRERSWPNLLAAMIDDFQREPVRLVNAGIGANVLSPRSAGYPASAKPAASERLEQHVFHHPADGTPLAPDLLVISYGLNDARGGTPLETFCEELRDVIRRVRERLQPLIVVVGPYYISDFAVGAPDWSHADLPLLYEYNEAMRSLAEECNCLFVDLMAAYGEADWLVHSDGVHANDLGHRVVANKVFEVLAGNCSGLALTAQAFEPGGTPWRDDGTLQQG